MTKGTRGPRSGNPRGRSGGAGRGPRSGTGGTSGGRGRNKSGSGSACLVLAFALMGGFLGLLAAVGYGIYSLI